MRMQVIIAFSNIQTHQKGYKTQKGYKKLGYNGGMRKGKNQVNS